MSKSIFPTYFSVLIYLLNPSHSWSKQVTQLVDHDHLPPENSTYFLPAPQPTDYLLQYPLIYIISITSIFLIQTVTLLLFGQPFRHPSGIKFWYGDTYGPENSQHLTDYYTFVHILHGFYMFYFGLLLPSVVTVNYSFLIALGVAALWEIVENTPCVIERYRKTAAAQGYSGDSVINSFCDTVFMAVGYWFAYLVPWYVTLVLALGEEILLAILIRDNFVLNVVQLVFSLKCISDWQAEKVRKVEGEVQAQEAQDESS